MRERGLGLADSGERGSLLLELEIGLLLGL